MIPALLGFIGQIGQGEEDKGPADWDWDIVSDIWPDIARGMWATVRLTVLGMIIATILGLAIAIIRRSRFKAVRWPVGVFVEFIRSTPLLIQLLFGFYVGIFGLSLSAWDTAMIVLGVHYACYMSESYRAGIESVPRGQWEASTSLNLAPVTTWREVILPQAIPTVIPALGNYLVASFKDAPIAMVIGVNGVLLAATDAQSQVFKGTEAFTITGVTFLVVSIPAAAFARYLERRYGYKRD